MYGLEPRGQPVLAALCVAVSPVYRERGRLWDRVSSSKVPVSTKSRRGPTAGSSWRWGRRNLQEEGGAPVGGNGIQVSGVEFKRRNTIIEE